MLTIALVEWKDRVSSAVRVSWSLGADRVLLVGSVWPKAKHLHSAKSMTIIEGELPNDAVLFEVDGVPLSENAVALTQATCLAFGGASFHFPKCHRFRLRIPQRRNPCLIGDQAISIALHERLRLC